MKNPPRRCSVCSKNISVKSAKAIVCSAVCLGARRAEINFSRRKAIMAAKRCSVCDGPIPHHRIATAKTCSNPCRSKNIAANRRRRWRLAAANRSPPVGACIICGSSFLVVTNRKACSPRCYHEHRKALMRELRQRNKPWQLPAAKERHRRWYIAMKERDPIGLRERSRKSEEKHRDKRRDRYAKMVASLKALRETGVQI